MVHPTHRLPAGEPTVACRTAGSVHPVTSARDAVAAHWAAEVRDRGSFGTRRAGASCVELDDEGKIASILDFWPSPYEPPADRAHLVEQR